MLTKIEEQFFEKSVGYWIAYMVSKIFATFFIWTGCAYMVSRVLPSETMPFQAGLLATLVTLFMLAIITLGTVALWCPQLFDKK